MLSTGLTDSIHNWYFFYVPHIIGFVAHATAIIIINIVITTSIEK